MAAAPIEGAEGTASRRGWLRENRGFLVFLLCFGVMRTAIADWNPVPTASMRPTILEGDVVLVNRLAYDAKVPLTDIALAPLGEPRRGDIVVFSSPKDGTRLIKRLVGLPGDLVEIRGDRLYLNGRAADYAEPENVFEALSPDLVVPALRATERSGDVDHRVQFLGAPDGAIEQALDRSRRFGPLRVPDGEYFMLGDNRNNSEDSRFIGTVPRRLLAGRAHRILVSAAITDAWQPRLERFGAALR